MAKIRWIGEGEDGPRVNTWRGIIFEVGKWVEIEDPHIVAKAKGNPYYEVEGDKPKAPPPKGAAPSFNPTISTRGKNE